MRKVVLTISFLFLVFNIYSQSYFEEISKHREKVNAEFKEADKSPLPKEEIKSFQGLPFFPIEEDYKVEATLEKIENAEPFQMKTTTDRLPTYKAFAIARFKLKGKEYRLTIYQNQKLIETEEYKNYLFLPFKDYTNGNESYGGGRYLDLEIPEADTISLDFNKSYNPYCAYNKKYSCPIPPKENSLQTEIKAGVKYIH